MTWYDAVKWCNAMSEKEGLRACYYKSDIFSPENVFRSGEHTLTNAMVDWNADGYRLPTEAEWEVTLKVLQAETAPVAEPVAFASGATSTARNQTQATVRVALPVPSRSQSGVWEWCWDCYSRDPVPTEEENPKGPETGSFRVSRDGTMVEKLGFYARMDLRPDLGASYRGFRVVRKSM